MKKLLLTLLFLGFAASCSATVAPTKLTINNKTGIIWKVKVESGGKFIKVNYGGMMISDWIAISPNSTISFDIDASAFTAMFRSGVAFKVTAIASDWIELSKKVTNASGALTLDVKEDTAKTVAQGKYSLSVSEFTVGQ
jgi:hypothetical protein